MKKLTNQEVEAYIDEFNDIDETNVPALMLEYQETQPHLARYFLNKYQEYLNEAMLTYIYTTNIIFWYVVVKKMGKNFSLISEEKMQEYETKTTTLIKNMLLLDEKASHNFIKNYPQTELLLYALEMADSEGFDEHNNPFEALLSEVEEGERQEYREFLENIVRLAFIGSLEVLINE